MIVQCQNCKTKFKLEDDKIKVTGSRVKCSKCGNIFVVFKSVDMLDREEIPVDKIPPQFEEKKEIPSPEGPDLPDSFSHTSAEEVKPYTPSPPKQKINGEDEIKFEEKEPSVEPVTDEKFTLESKEKAGKPFSFAMADSEKSEEKSVEYGDRPQIQYTTMPGFQITQEDRKKVEIKSSFSPSMFVVLAMIVFLGLASGYLALYLISNYSFNVSLKDFSFSYSEKETSIKNIKIVNLKTNYLLNSKNEKLLVVRGDFKNISASSFDSVEYKVTVLGVKGEILQEREMRYLPPPEQLDLVNLSWQEVNQKIQRKDGKGAFSSTSKVLEANSIKPFLVVFKDIDPSAKEVKVEITGGG